MPEPDPPPGRGPVQAVPVRAGFYAEGAFDPPSTRAALATLASPVLVYAGELDAVSPPELLAQVAGLFPGWALTVQPGAQAGTPA